ncbi:MAG: sulfurtransferase [Gammaproteobacteria bacterium]|nr:sulfurtransferase [Gammaproteobacteria bacterium]
MGAPLPLLLEPAALAGRLDDPQLLLVDLSGEESYAKRHLPGALHLPYAKLVSGAKPAPGLMPPVEDLRRTLSALGVCEVRHVVAMDDEGGGRACRLLWTLEVFGHEKKSLLNGGMAAWANEGHPLSAAPVRPLLSVFENEMNAHAVAGAGDVLQSLADPGTALLDARTPEEFCGKKIRAKHAGHIPGAKNLNWLDTVDGTRNLRLKPDDDLKKMLHQRGLTPGKTIIPYCQTHHRSAHSYVMLRHLGYEKVKAYAGSWSEWGNLEGVPVESGNPPYPIGSYQK